MMNLTIITLRKSSLFNSHYTLIEYIILRIPSYVLIQYQTYQIKISNQEIDTLGFITVDL